MYITVEEALKIGGLKYARLLAGKRNLKNIIKYIDTMEVPDIESWLREDELLITTGFAIKNDIAKLKNLIKYMSSIKAAGLAIKPNRSFGQIPDTVIRLAEKEGLPLIEIPKDIPFIDITHPILKAILGRQARRLEFSQQAHKALLKVGLEGEGLKDIADTLRSLIENDVLICDNDFKLLTYSTNRNFEEIGIPKKDDTIIIPDDIKKRISKTNETIKFNLNTSCEFWIRPVKVKNKVLGYVIVSERLKQISEMEVEAIEHATTTVALEFVKQQAVIETRLRMQKDFFDDLIQGNINDLSIAKKRAYNLRWPINKPTIIVSIDIDDFTTFMNAKQDENDIQSFKQRFANIIEIELNNHGFIDSIVISRSDSLVCMIPLQEINESRTKKLIKTCEDLHDIVRKKLKVEISTGISTPGTGLNSIIDKYWESRNALLLGRKVFGKGCCVHIDQMDIYEILHDYPDKEKLKRLYFNTLGKLEEHDKKNKTDFLKVLKTYINNRGVRNKTAEQLYIHRNTLNYKLKQIEEIIGKSLENEEMFFKISLAFRIKALFG